MNVRLTGQAVFACIAMSAITACGQKMRSLREHEAYSKLHGDSGIGNSGRDYEKIRTELKDLNAKYPMLTDLIEYGQTERGNTLTAIKIYDKSLTSPGSTQKRPAVLISEAIHGNEYLNISDRLPREFLQGTNSTAGLKKLLAKGGVVYIVPIINPDGYEGRQRENSRGLDLNRNFVIKAVGNNGFSEPETKGITDLMAKETSSLSLSLDMTMEYHCCIGGLIHPWNYNVNKKLEGDLLQRKNEILSIFNPIFPGFLVGNVRDVVNYPQGAVGGSDDYYLETYQKRAFSFEGREGREHQYLAQHVEFWDKTFSLIADQATGGNPLPQSASGMFAAIAEEPQADSFVLKVSSPLDIESVELCVGEVAVCRVPGSTAIRASVTFQQVVGTQRIYRANTPIRFVDSQILTITPLKTGIPDATKSSAVLRVKKLTSSH